MDWQPQQLKLCLSIEKGQSGLAQGATAYGPQPSTSKNERVVLATCLIQSSSSLLHLPAGGSISVNSYRANAVLILVNGSLAADFVPIKVNGKTPFAFKEVQVLTLKWNSTGPLRL